MKTIIIEIRRENKNEHKPVEATPLTRAISVSLSQSVGPRMLYTDRYDVDNAVMLLAFA